MLHLSKWRPRADKTKACFKQRLIETHAVVSDQNAELLQVFGQCVKKARFLRVLAHEKLTYIEAVRRDAADAYQKSESAGAPSETGRFRVEERPRCGRGIGNAAVRNRMEQVAGQFFQIGNIHAA